jgi:L-lactate dehydrogenase complex protein LldG
VAEAEAMLMALHPGAKVICSAVPEIAGTRRVEKVRDPHEHVDMGIVRAPFGVAETGAIWLTQEDLVVDALAVLSQHLMFCWIQTRSSVICTMLIVACASMRHPTGVS